MKVLVCGGAGYIGSHAAADLLDMGHEIVVADNLSSGHRELVDQRAVFYQVDLRDEIGLDAVFKKHRIDVVMHFAASIIVSESVEEPLKYYENNFFGTLCLLKTMKKNNVNKIIFSSTAATYGEPERVPVMEEDKQKPINPYGMSKLFVEKMLEDCRKAYGLNYIVFRYFNVSGAHEKHRIGQMSENFTHLIPVILETASGKRDHMKVFGTDYPTSDGTCIRDYIHVVDLVRAHILAAEKLASAGSENETADKKGEGGNIMQAASPEPIGLAYNLGNGSGFSVKEMIKAAEEVTGKSINVIESGRREGDPAVLVADSSKARFELGWEPQYREIKKIIETAWRWHNEMQNSVL